MVNMELLSFRSYEEKFDLTKNIVYSMDEYIINGINILSNSKMECYR